MILERLHKFTTAEVGDRFYPHGRVVLKQDVLRRIDVQLVCGSHSHAFLLRESANGESSGVTSMLIPWLVQRARLPMTGPVKLEGIAGAQEFLPTC